MKSLILFAFFISCTFLSVAQTKVFKTYEEYRDGKGEVMDNEYGDYSVGTFGHVLKFKTTDGKLVKYKTDEIWGFLFQGKFFRSVGKSEIAMLFDTGKVNYYINGYVGMYTIIHHKKIDLTYFQPFFKYEAACFLSVGGDTNAKLYMMPIDNYTRLDYKQFKTDFPDLESLHDCFKFKGSTYEIPNNIWECVKEYNAINLKKKK